MTWQMSGPSRIINGDETLQVERLPQTVDEGVFYIDGKPSAMPGTVTTFELRANVQPLAGRDLLLLPEGDRYSDQIYAWTNQVDPGLRSTDLIMRGGVTYQVQESQEWGSYHRARAVNVDQLPELDGA